MMKSLFAIALLSLMTACQTAPVSFQPPHPAALVVQEGDSKIGTFISSGDSFETSSYWIEGPTGLVMIDTQFVFSTATQSIDWAEKLTGKKVVLAIVLHPNPDKFNGTEIFQKRGIRVVTSEQVAKWIPSVHQDRYKSFYSRYKPDYPVNTPKIETFGSKTTQISAAGLPLTLHVLGAGASEAHVVVEYEKHIFPGDLIANMHHSWLEIGKTDEWLKRIEEMRKLEPEWVHPGRGPSGGAELLDREETYLKDAIAAVKPFAKRKILKEEDVQKIVETLTDKYVGYGNEYFLEIGLPAEWRRQAKASK